MVNSRTFVRELDGEYVIGEDNRLMSREQILLAITAVPIKSGTILGKITEGAVTLTPAAVAGNTGNGTMNVPTADADTNAGRFRVEFYAATKFNVINPAGIIVGKGTTGVAFDGPINFTITAGGTPFAVGDAFTVDVAIASANQWAPLNLTATNGGEIAKGILFLAKPISTGTQRAVAHVRNTRANGRKLIFPTGATTDQKSAIIAQLAGMGADGYGNIQVGF